MRRQELSVISAAFAAELFASEFLERSKATLAGFI
jgi:hypothetical protein